MLPTTNIIQRTFLIRQGNFTGTAFSIEVGDREYFVTAKHVVPNISSPVLILHDRNWELLPTTGLFHHPGKPDVAVFTLSQQIAPRYRVDPGMDGVRIGQNLLIVGYPFGWSNTQLNFNRGYPIPFVKAAILSALITDGDCSMAYLDGHSNRGFSGSPVIAEHVPPKDPQFGPKIIGIVSASNNERTSHPSEVNPPQTHTDGYPLADDHVHLTNSGFIASYNIKHAIEIIEANPQGFELSAE